MRRQWLRRVAAGAALLAAAACSGSGNAAAPAASTQLRGLVPQVHNPRPSFSLRTIDGATYDFGAKTQGAVTLLYFGYTHCPDQCPATMATIARALEEIPAAVARSVRVVFVTTDPRRDTPAVLRAWLARFHPPYPTTGLTGTPAQIAVAERRVGVPVATEESAKPSDHVGAYAVGHYAAALAYGRNDRVAALYPSGTTPPDLAADLKVLAKESPRT